MKSKQEQRADVRNVLDGLEKALEARFAEGRIWYEADIHQAVLYRLTRELVDVDERWVIGSEHPIGRDRPDVTCYYRTSERYVDFFNDTDAAIAAIIEIKFRSDLGDDISKLTRMVEKQDVLRWMIYGDHFDEHIHPGNAEKHQERAMDIKQWVAGAPEARGGTILRCGKINSKPLCGDALSAINQDVEYWRRTKRGGRGERDTGE